MGLKWRLKWPQNLRLLPNLCPIFNDIKLYAAEDETHTLHNLYPPARRPSTRWPALVKISPAVIERIWPSDAGLVQVASLANVYNSAVAHLKAHRDMYRCLYDQVMRLTKYWHGATRDRRGTTITTYPCHSVGLPQLLWPSLSPCSLAFITRAGQCASASRIDTARR